jgi:hypothetical protein
MAVAVAVVVIRIHLAVLELLVRETTALVKAEKTGLAAAVVLGQLVGLVVDLQPITMVAMVE